MVWRALGQNRSRGTPALWTSHEMKAADHGTSVSRPLRFGLSTLFQ
jgi:hypothetical protein